MNVINVPKDLVDVVQNVLSKKEVVQTNEEYLIEANVLKHVASGNEGYGFHGEMSTKYGTTGAGKRYSQMHAKVKRVTGHSHDETVKHYLDSAHGRHLADHSGNDEYIKKDFSKFLKKYNPEHFKESLDIDHFRNHKILKISDGVNPGITLHPEHQNKISDLNDKGSTSFSTLAGEGVKASRNGDQIKLVHGKKQYSIHRSHFSKASNRVG